jgi:rod shape-determining protein MreC
MRDFLRRLRLPLLFAALLLLTLLSILGARGDGREGDAPSWAPDALIEIAAPVQRAIALPAVLLGDAWTRYIALVDLRSENEVLRRTVSRLEGENLQFREALVQSGHLARIAEMRAGFEVELMPSEVVGQDVSPWFRSVLLDRGSRDAVHTGMPVVADQGLVGLVTATTPNAARTMMLLDRRSAVDAIIERSRARGIVRGTGSGALEFVFMVRGDDVQDGDNVITSGVGGVYPKGLRVGKVTRVQRETSKLIHTAAVQPNVDFGRLEQVFVMLQRGPTMDLLFQADGDLDPAPEPPTATEDAAPAPLAADGT